MRHLHLIAAAAAALVPALASAHDLGQASYLGNAGILVARGDTKILFDAFYAESFDGTYSLVPDAIEDQMMRGLAPFDGVDAIFISHIHPDHFNSRKTIAYLRAHPNVRLYAGIDVVGAIRAADASSDPLMKRVTAVHAAPGAPPAKYDVDGLAIEAFPIPHSGDGPTPNYAFRVTIDGATTVMHLGDARRRRPLLRALPEGFRRQADRPRFPAYWILISELGKRVIEQRIRPAKAIGIHVEAKERKHPDQTRRETGRRSVHRAGRNSPASARSPIGGDSSCLVELEPQGDHGRGRDRSSRPRSQAYSATER